MIRPNLFSAAPKELAQDGYFTWLLEWANEENESIDSQLNSIAKDFVKLLISRQYDTSSLEISTVFPERNWNHIDILTEVNNEYVIILEDKTSSGEHSEQLERYKTVTKEHYKDTNFKLVFIYLKTGNESLMTLNLIEEKGYAVIDRKSILDVLKSRPVQNNILIDFKEHLTSIDERTESYHIYEKLISDGMASEGFFLKLQKANLEKYLNTGITNWEHQIGHWSYVNTFAGGFLGYWYHWNSTELCSVYIQIENAGELYNRLVIKIGDWEPKTALLYEMMSDIKVIGEKYGLTLVKPSRYNAGDTSTLAIVENAFTVDSNGILDVAKFKITMDTLEKVIDEYCNSRKTA